jgi:hypothetical protein
MEKLCTETHFLSLDLPTGPRVCRPATWSMEDRAGWDRRQRYNDHWGDSGLYRELDADSAT